MKYIKIQRNHSDYSYLPSAEMSAAARRSWLRHSDCCGEVIEVNGGVRDRESFTDAERAGRLVAL